jgi:hypothetical protein
MLAPWKWLLSLRWALNGNRKRWALTGNVLFDKTNLHVGHKSGKSGGEENEVCVGGTLRENLLHGSFSLFVSREFTMLCNQLLVDRECSVGITLAIVLPRVPDFQFNADHPLVAASSDFNKTVPTYFNRIPTNFSFPGTAQLQLDTGSSYIPIHMRDIHADVFDLDTSMHIGDGHIDSLALPAKQFTQVQLPLNFSYSVSNMSDVTCK